MPYYIRDNQNAELETTDEGGQIESRKDTQETGQVDSEVREEGSPTTEGATQEGAAMNFDVIAAMPHRNSNKLLAPNTEIRKIPKIIRKNSTIFLINH